MMPGITASQLAAASNAMLIGEDVEVGGVSIDSRSVQQGDVFVAIKGERVDGHDFLEAAQNAGASAAVVEQQQSSDITQIVVADSARALAAIAGLNRGLFKGTIIAITGSAGKTSCKNMVASLLASRYNVCATSGNLNNELGVPLTLSRLTANHDVGVIEMGAAKPGDISYLCDIARPDISLLTNVNEAHLGGFGSIELTAKTKGEIFASLEQSGVAVLNADDHFADYWRKTIASAQRDIQVIDFSLQHSSAAVYVRNIQVSLQGTEFDVVLTISGQPVEFRARLPLLGEHNVANAAAAIAVAAVLQVDNGAMQAALEKVQPAKGRLQLRQANNSLTLIDDSYNANPQAVVAAAKVLASIAGVKDCPSVMVLGDMGELGEQAGEKHIATGRAVAEQGIDRLFACGEHASDYVRGFEQYASAKQQAGGAREFSCKQELVDELLSDACANAAVLVKGSRFAAMDEVVEQLVNEPVWGGIH